VGSGGAEHVCSIVCDISCTILSNELQASVHWCGLGCSFVCSNVVRFSIFSEWLVKNCTLNLSRFCCGIGFSILFLLFFGGSGGLTSRNVECNWEMV
jgi:hypothetical protein